MPRSVSPLYYPWSQIPARALNRRVDPEAFPLTKEIAGARIFYTSNPSPCIFGGSPAAYRQVRDQKATDFTCLTSSPSPPCSIVSSAAEPVGLYCGATFDKADVTYMFHLQRIRLKLNRGMSA